MANDIDNYLPTKRPDVLQFYLGEGLTDTKLTNYRQGGIVVGDFFEEATKELFGPDNVDRLAITTDRTCPDLIHKEKNYLIESKAAGSSWGKYTKIFEHTIHNYTKLLQDLQPHAPLLYFIFWVHDVKVGDYDYKSDLHKALAAGETKAYIVDFLTLRAALETKRMRTYKNYGSMWRLFHTELRLLETNWKELLKKWGLSTRGYTHISIDKFDAEVYGEKMTPFSVQFLTKGKALKQKSIINLLNNVKELSNEEKI